MKKAIKIIMNAGDAEEELCLLIDSILDREGASNEPNVLDIAKEFIDGAKEMKDGNKEVIDFFVSAFKHLTQK